jgi:hypothetical protein
MIKSQCKNILTFPHLDSADGDKEGAVPVAEKLRVACA